MYQKDKIKAISAAIIVGSITLTFGLFGKEIAKYVAIAGIVIWLGVMLSFSNKKKT